MHSNKTDRLSENGLSNSKYTDDKENKTGTENITFIVTVTAWFILQLSAYKKRVV